MWRWSRGHKSNASATKLGRTDEFKLGTERSVSQCTSHDALVKNIKPSSRFTVLAHINVQTNKNSRSHVAIHRRSQDILTPGRNYQICAPTFVYLGIKLFKLITFIIYLAPPKSLRIWPPGANVPSALLSVSITSYRLRFTTVFSLVLILGGPDLVGQANN